MVGGRLLFNLKSHEVEIILIRLDLAKAALWFYKREVEKKKRQNKDLNQINYSIFC